MNYVLFLVDWSVWMQKIDNFSQSHIFLELVKTKFSFSCFFLSSNTVSEPHMGPILVAVLCLGSLRSELLSFCHKLFVQLKELLNNYQFKWNPTKLFCITQLMMTAWCAEQGDILNFIGCKDKIGLTKAKVLLFTDSKELFVLVLFLSN